MMTEGYPFIQEYVDRRGADDLMEYTIQYRFESSKSGHSYIVRVERYIEHTYCVKFYDDANRQFYDKYSMRSSTFEARTILYTVMNIMLDVYKQDENASFFFIGAEDEKDVRGKATRRYRIYHSFVSSVVGDSVFTHSRNDLLSLYILVNKKNVVDIKAYAERISNMVADLLF